MKSTTALIVDRLHQRFPAVPEATIAAMVATSEATFLDARIRDYIPLLIEREVKDLLAHRGDDHHPASRCG